MVVACNLGETSSMVNPLGGLVVAGVRRDALHNSSLVGSWDREILMVCSAMYRRVDEAVGEEVDLKIG
jgi:hypothetical protein